MLVSFKDFEVSLMIFGESFKSFEESSKIVVESTKILIESMTSSRFLWPRVHAAGVQPGHDCSHCHIHGHDPGSR